MSRKKFNNKVELFEELFENLQELKDQLDMVINEINLNHKEESDYLSIVATPYENLLTDLQAFVTDLDNGVYEEESDGVEYED